MPFGTTVGGTPLVKSYVGTTPTKRIYVGSTHVWPPISAAVTYVASLVFTGTTSTNFPAHTPGDLLVVVAMGGAAPTAPAGWTVVHTSPSGNPAARMAYKWATGTTASTGSWTGNAVGTMYVFRNANTTTPFGTIGTNVGPSSATVTAPGITLTDPSGDSVVVHAYHNNGSTGAWVNKTPAGFINKNQQARLANSQMIDTEGATVPSSVMTHSSAATWRSLAFEVLAPAAATEEPQELYAVEQVNKPGRVVDFTAKKGFVPEGDAAGDEAFMFRCSTISGLDGYVGRTFTKTFPGNTAYSRFDCTLEDLYGDGSSAAGSLTKTKLTFQVTPTA